MSTRKQTKTKNAGKPQGAKARKTAKTPAAASAPKSSTTKERDPRIPGPGSTLTRVYKGKEHRLKVLADGFEYEGETYRSLTAAAKRATGYPSIAGTEWWGVTKRAPAKPKGAKSKEKNAAPKSDATQPAADAAAPTA